MQTQASSRRASDPGPDLDPSSAFEEQVEARMGQVIDRMGGFCWFLLTAIGLRTGLWAKLAGAGAQTPAQAAQRTGLAEPYVREWLRGQAAAGFVDYDPDAGTFTVPDDVAVLLADPDSPGHLGGFVDIGLAFNVDWEAVAADFPYGQGVGWHEHSALYWEGLDAAARPMIGQFLAPTWIPSLDGVDAKLRSGGNVADVGCGYGWPSIVVAEAYPHATVRGFDYHQTAITHARAAATQRGLDSRVRFDVADATAFAGRDFDLVMFVDCLHDLGDPVAALRHARAALAPRGTVLLIEPAGGDRVEDNFHPLGVMSYTTSVLACTPNSLSQGGDPLGTLAGEPRLREVADQAGFSRVSRLDVEAPMNLLLELRP